MSSSNFSADVDLEGDQGIAKIIDEPEERPSQPAGEEAAPASPNTEPLNPLAERQVAKALEKEQYLEEPAEEDVALGTKDDQDRQRQADETLEEDDASPLKKSNASSWNGICMHKPMVRSSECHVRESDGRKDRREWPLSSLLSRVLQSRRRP